ncbi:MULTISPECIES: hypothetical protein [unclassified Pasteurella]|uniref:hypothetical protein n=1 Tax=unclassified Pasteurella TaxID=2621516 RepID=UPI0010739700|nr:hypothetical protein [Pasteurella sp. 19428wF3_WM03]TFU50985.1 hypothetical protein E4T92_06300 [Pasteurella sp. WM03]
MDNQRLIDIVSASSKKSFIYHLHYRNKFSKQKFNTIKKAYKFYIKNQSKIDKNMQLRKDFINTFEHTLFLFICDSDKNDFFEIKPYLSIEEKTNIYFDIREMTDTLLSLS